MAFDVVLVDASVLTMNVRQPRAEAVGITGDRIEAVGKNVDIKGGIGPNTRVFALRGATVLPGFIDNHTHFLHTGLSLISVNLVDTEDISDVLRNVKEAASYHPVGTLIRGYGYDEQKFPQQKPPTKKELDAVAPNHLVWLNRVDYHSSVINTRLLQVLAIPPGTDGLEKDERGVPNGVLRAEADQVARSFIANHLDPGVRKHALEMASQFAVTKGITTVSALEGGDDFGVEEVKLLLADKQGVSLRIEVFYQTTDVDRVLELGLERIGGCILLDGSLGSRTAALSAPYSDDDDNNGILYFTQEELNQFVLAAHRAGLQIAAHAIGDRAIEQLLNAYELAQKLSPRSDPRHRVEHFELPTDRQIVRAKRLGLILSMQPTFEFYWGGLDNLYGQRLGEERINRSNPLREIFDAGVMVAGGSDASVTPMNPMYGIHSAINHPNPMQQTSLVEALRMFTINGAYALGVEKERGSIEVGKAADLVVLEENPLRIAPQRIKDIQVTMTFIAGMLVYPDRTWKRGV
ncbi:amidohydrolase [Metallumcola ferriviriculae]|uniref:Amidohydrolase n=1 Tax=Metallumcola ferriviriculae TaxID=3039180 RepID=A0AAU0US02_9FIRM|nr:amidohydrolase [Desulfitibacteraceae bacterium MK1]